MNTKFIMHAMIVAIDLERVRKILSDLYNESNYTHEKQIQIKEALNHIREAKADFF